MAGTTRSIDTVVLEKLSHVNAVLLKLSKDEDLQDDLKLPAVVTAIDHWTGKNRLTPEKAQLLQNNRRVVYVLQRFQLLQAVCREAGMSVPLDHLLSGKQELVSSLVNRLFGSQTVVERTVERADARSHQKTSALEKEKKIADTNGPAAPTQTTLHSSSSAATVAAVEHANNASADQVTNQDTTPRSKECAVVSDATGTVKKPSYDINDLLKVAIAVTFVLIAITLGQLLL